MSSFEGIEPKVIAKTLRKYYDIFKKLCMIEDPPTTVEKIVEKPIYRNIKRKYKGKIKHINTIKRDINGWGRCPVCGGKIIKINADSFLLNFPAYCKWCKKEYVVTWCNTSIVQK